MVAPMRGSEGKDCAFDENRLVQTVEGRACWHDVKIRAVDECMPVLKELSSHMLVCSCLKNS